MTGGNLRPSSGRSGSQELEPDLLDAALPIAWAVPDGGLREQGLVLFAPAVPVTGEVSVLGQIVALLGRRPGVAGVTAELRLVPWVPNEWIASSSEPGSPGRPRPGPWRAGAVR